MRLELQSLTFSFDPAHTAPGVAGALGVRRDDGTAAGVPDFALGWAGTPPPAVADAFPDLAPLRAGGLWFHTDLSRTDQRWFVQLGVRDVVLVGEAAAGAIDGGPLAIDPPTIAVRLESRGHRSPQLFARLTAGVRLAQPVGPIRVDGLRGRIAIDLDIAAIPDAERILAAPQSLLDGGFTGRAIVELDAPLVELLPGVELAGANMTLEARVTCVAGTRRLDLADVALRLAGDVRVAGARFVEARLDAAVRGWSRSTPGSIDLHGDATVVLPAAVGASLSAGPARARLSFAQNAAGTRITVDASGLRLAPTLNVLELDGSRLHVALVRPAGAPEWQLAMDGEVTQSWSRVATRLHAARLVDADRHAGLPDVRARVALTLPLPAAAAATPGRFDLVLGLALVRDGAPYRGRLGRLPIDVDTVELTLAARFGQGAFDDTTTVSGHGRVSAARELATALPFDDVELGAALERRGAATPTLVITAGNLPALVLPPLVRGAAPVSLVAIRELRFDLRDALAVRGTVALLPGVSASTLTARLGLPAAFNGLVEPIGRLLAGTGRVEIVIDPPTGRGRLTVAYEMSDAPHADPFGALRALFPGGAVGDRHRLETPLLDIQPRSVSMTTTFGDGAPSALEIAGTYACAVLGETFDARFAFRVNGPTFELVLAIGVDDPVRLTIASPDPFGGKTSRAIVNDLARSYSLTGSDRAALEQVIDGIVAFFDQPGMRQAATFELSHLEVAFRPADASRPVEVSGVIRPVRLPEFVQRTLPVVPSVRLGATARSFFFELEVLAPPSGEPAPLFSIPVGPNGHVDFVLHGFRVGYAWDVNAIDLSLSADLNLVGVPTFSPQIGTGLRLPPARPNAPSVASTFSVRTIAATAVVPEWGVSFGDAADPANVGAELIVGIPGQRFVTLRTRRTSFSLTRTLFGPGADLDASFVFGTPPPAGTPTPRPEFYFQGRCLNATFITLPVHIGALLNPLAIIPPFLSPAPPYWVIPGLMMGDVFFERLDMTLNVPHLLFGTIALEKPMPALSIAALAELAYLASQGFAVPLPDDSPLFSVFFVRLTGALQVPLPPALFGTSRGSARLADLVALDVEINAADALEALTEALGAARQMLNTAQDGLERLRDDPALLIRMVPRPQRQMTFDLALAIAGLRLSLDASAFLLTPEELREELVLYHENRRPAGVGTARVRRRGTTSPGPRVPIRDDVPEGFIDRPFETPVWRHPRDAFDRSGPALTRYLLAKTNAVDASARTRVERMVRAKLAGRLRDALDERIFRGRDPLLRQLTGTAAGNRDARRTLLKDAGFAHAVTELERLYAVYVRRPGPAAATALGEGLRDFLLEHPALSARAPIGEGALTAVTRAILDEVLVDRPAAAGRSGTFAIAPRADRDRALGARFGRLDQARVRQAVEAEAADADARLRRQPPRTDADRRAFRIDLEARISKAVTKEGSRFERLEPDRALPARFGSDVLRARLDGLFVDRGDRVGLTRHGRIFDVLRGRTWVDRISGWRPPSATAPGSVREVTGYRAVPRPDGGFAHVPFSLDVPGPNVTLRVRFRGGRYVLVASDAAGQEVAHEPLPAAFTDVVPRRPGAAATLRREFTVVEAERRRPATASERAARDAAPVEQADHLYQQSLFARPEYEIKPSGGHRGALTLGDLLRDPSTHAYVVPAGPVLIAGVRVRLFSNVDIGMTGLIAPPAGSTGAGLLLRGHHDVRLDLPLGYVLRLVGDFHVVAGDLWPTTLADPDIVRNAVSFNGLATLERGGHTVFTGSARGDFHYPAAGGAPEFSVGVAVHLNESWEAEVFDTKLTKVWVDDQANIQVRFDGSHLSVAASGTLSIHWQVATFATKTIDLPAVEVCVLNPIGLLPGQPDWLCETIDGGTLEVPDPTHLTWGRVQTETITASASLDTSGHVAIDLTFDSQPALDFTIRL